MNSQPDLSHSLPVEFIERFGNIVPLEFYDDGLRSFTCAKKYSFRVNVIKTNIDEVKEILNAAGIVFDPVPWCPEGLVLEESEFLKLNALGLTEKGWVYRQNLSSMLVARVLNPGPHETVLDLCAAPGSKATHMAAMMNNSGEMICVEPVRSRFYRLKSVAELMDARMISFVNCDGRQYRISREKSARGFSGFDKILVDAPCSSEGRFHTDNPKTYQYWSLRKIREMVKKQRGLIRNALRLLEPGGLMVYSTCTFAPEENEGVISWLLDKEESQCRSARILLTKELKKNNVKIAPAVTYWKNKMYNEQVGQSMRILPDERMEGFFMAAIEKKDA